MRGTRPRPPWQNPTQPIGVSCPNCLAAPGRACTGLDVERFFHGERKRVAAENAAREGASR